MTFPPGAKAASLCTVLPPPLASKDGVVRFAAAVWVQNGMLLYKDRNGSDGRLDLAAVDGEATHRLNEERGLTWQIPIRNAIGLAELTYSVPGFLESTAATPPLDKGPDRPLPRSAARDSGLAQKSVRHRAGIVSKIIRPGDSQPLTLRARGTT